MIIAGARTRVVVNNQVFEVPSEKINDLIGFISRLNSVAINEHERWGESPPLQYNGISLIQG